MASDNALLQQQKSRVSNYLDSLKNDDLKRICRAYGEQVSGTKVVLVHRCQRVLDDIVKRGDIAAFEDLKNRAHVLGLTPLQPPGAASSSNSYSSTSTYRPYGMAPQRGSGGPSQNRIASERKGFKSSPFYQVLEELLDPQVLTEMPQNRNSVRRSLVIEGDLGQRLRNDGNLRILLYCRETHDPTPSPNVDIKFPNQIEVKVNNSDVKHNFKGLKNKPGSTKPADITSLLYKFGGQKNDIVITYALTTKRFSWAVHLARYISADKLVDRIKAGSFIPKDQVIREMMRSNAESDIVATSYILSLKDPVSTVRISLPVRSSHCEHNQCFDGAMFLQLQEQAPQWTCPVCNKHVAFESLCVDRYFEDILKRTSQATEKVEIQPNGDWHAVKDDEDGDSQADGPKPRAPYDDDFDDLIELDEPVSKPVNGLKRESLQLPSLSPLNTPSFPIHTPPLSSREASVAQSAASAQRPNNKRPQSAVIDLTLSDDEEDEPPRPAKRQSTIQTQRQTGAQSHSYNTPTSLPDPRFHPPPQQPSLQNQQSYGGSSLGQANSYRSQYPAQQQTNSTGNATHQSRQSYPPNNLTFHHTSLSPANHTASPFSPHPPSPAWPQQHSRPTTAPQNNQHQHQQPQHLQSLFPPPSNSFPLRPPSASTPLGNQSSNNNSNAMHGGLRLPPLQMNHPSLSHGTSFSPEIPQDSFSGWRDGAAFDSEWGDFGSLGGSSP